MPNRRLLSPFDRAYGCLLGLAIGDAMGMPTSFFTASQVRERFGRIRDFQAPPEGHLYHDGLQRGEITDDTEQSLALAGSFLEKRHVDPEDIVERLLAWAKRVKGKYASPFGPSTEKALVRIKQGALLSEAGQHGDTNGAAMRIAPLGIIHGARQSSMDEVIEDTALACLPTHGTQTAISAAAGISWAIASCFGKALTTRAVLRESKQAAIGANRYGCETVAASVPKRIEWVERQLQDGRSGKRLVRAMYEFFGGGVASADSIPIALGIFCAADGDPAQAILIAANMGGDADTIAAIAGAIAGTFSGGAAFPTDWVNTVQGVNRLELEPLAYSLVAVADNWQLS